MWRMLIPNSLTAYRLCVGLVLPGLYLHGWRLGLLVFGVTAAASDLLDGFSARLLKSTSELGKKFDPVADMTLCIGGVSVVLIDVGVTWYALIYWVPVAWAAYYTVAVSAMRCHGLIEASNLEARVAIALMMISGCAFYGRITLHQEPDPSFRLERIAIGLLIIGCVFEMLAIRKYRLEASQTI